MSGDNAKEAWKKEVANYVDPVIEVYKKDIDRTLIRENLKLTHERRLLNLMKLQQFAQELHRAGAESRRRRK
jgi:hypothetical protein